MLAAAESGTDGYSHIAPPQLQPPQLSRRPDVHQSSRHYCVLGTMQGMDTPAYASKLQTLLRSRDNAGYGYASVRRMQTGYPAVSQTGSLTVSLAEPNRAESGLVERICCRNRTRCSRNNTRD